MKFIRLGTDINIVWQINRYDSPEDFAGKDITVHLISKCGCTVPFNYYLEEGQIKGTFYGADQCESGSYRLELVENDGKPEMVTLDYIDAFCLSKTLKNRTTSGQDSSSNIKTETVELTSIIDTNGFVERDPYFNASPAATITDENINDWNNKVKYVDYGDYSVIPLTTGTKQVFFGLDWGNGTASAGDLSMIAGTTYLGGTKLIDLFANKADVAALNDYVTKSNFDSLVEHYNEHGRKQEETNNLIKLDIKNLQSNKANKTDIPDISNLATKNELANYVTNGVFNTFKLGNDSELRNINSNIEEANLQIWLLSNNKADKSDLDNYATKSELNNKANIIDLAEYTKGSDFKTINGESILGEGNITIQGGTSSAVTSVNGATGDVTINVPTKTSELENDSKFATTTTLKNYQKTLISGTNIKTINGESILGSGDIVIQGGSGDGGSYDDTEIRGIIEQAKADIEKYDSTKADYTWDANDFGAFDGGYHKTHGSGESGTDPLTQNLPSECYTDQQWNSCSGILYSILENTTDLHGYQFYFCCSGTYEGNIYVRFNANVKQPWGYWGTWKQLGGESGGSSAGGDVYSTMDNYYSGNNTFNGAVTVNYDYTNVNYAGQPWSLEELKNGKYVNESLNTQANYIGYRYNANMQKITTGVFNYVEQEGYMVFEFEKPFDANYATIGFNGEYIEPYKFQSGKLNEADSTYTAVVSKDKPDNWRLFVTYRTEDVPVIDGSYVIPEVTISYNNNAYYDPIIQKRIQWGNGINAIDYGSYVSVEANATGGGSAVTSVNGATGDVTINVPTHVSQLENDEGYATYGDLSNYATKDEIPSLEGYAKTTDIPDTSNFATKSEITPQTPNIIKYGNPAFSNGQIMNFSETNYAKFPFLVDLRDKSSFKIMMNITTGDDVITQQNIIDGDKGLALAIRNGQWVLAVSTDGVNWVGEMFGGSVQSNTNYPFVELEWDNGRYTLKYHDGQYYTTAIDHGIISAPYPCNILIGKDVSGNYPFRGTIDLNGCYLEIDNNRVWNGMGDVGLATRLDTSLSNIDANGENKIKEIVGEIPTIPDLSIYATKQEVEELRTMIGNINTILTNILADE